MRGLQQARQAERSSIDVENPDNHDYAERAERPMGAKPPTHLEGPGCLALTLLLPWIPPSALVHVMTLPAI